MTRRRFSRGLVPTLTALATLKWLAGCQQEAYDAEMRAWLLDLDALSSDIKRQRIGQDQWHAGAEELLSRFELADVFELVDFEQLRQSMTLPSNGAAKSEVQFSDLAGPSDDLNFVHQVFGLGEGRAIVPHGHNNMVSAFLVLEGEFVGRHFDRLEDQADHILIEPTIEDSFGPGGITTLTDDEDNVHWFSASGGPGFLFNVHVRDVVDGAALPTGRVYVDPNGEHLGGGIIRAPRLNSARAHELYG